MASTNSNGYYGVASNVAIITVLQIVGGLQRVLTAEMHNQGRKNSL